MALAVLIFSEGFATNYNRFLSRITSGEALSGLIGLGGGDTCTVGKYFGADLATFPSCFVTFGVKMAETGGGINISEKILSIS